MAYSYEDTHMGDEQSVHDHPDHNFKDQVQLAGNTLPLEPQGSISRVGQDTYRRETSRDSVTGSFRTQDEAKGISTTRVKPNQK